MSNAVRKPDDAKLAQFSNSVGKRCTVDRMKLTKGRIVDAGMAVFAEVGYQNLSMRQVADRLDAGLPAANCGIAADTLLSHITGFVLQEQNQPANPPQITAELHTELCEQFPLLMGPLIPRPSQDEKFAQSIRLLCTGFTAIL